MMNWVKYSIKTYLLCILAISFFIQTDMQAQQISQLPCLPSWWSQDHTPEEVETVHASDDNVLLQQCDEDGNTPLHIALISLKLDPLSVDQTGLICAWARDIGRDGLQLYRNRQGENPLMLFEARFGRMLAEISYSSSEELQNLFEEESFVMEVVLYILVQTTIMGNSRERAMSEVLTAGISSLLDQLGEGAREFFLERLLEMESMSSQEHP